MADDPINQLDRRRKEFPDGKLAEIVNTRASERHVYEGFVGAAAYSHGSVPDRKAFANVRATDISSTGIALILPEIPSSNSIIVMLRIGEADIFMHARVVHQREGYWDRKRQFLVGCEFLHRLHPDW